MNRSTDESDCSSYDDEDESRFRLPAIVEDELERRKRYPSLLPNETAIQALRQYFQAGVVDAFISGGFLSMMRELGATPKSNDFLSKDIEYNLWYFGPADERQQREWWSNRIEQHA